MTLAFLKAVGVDLGKLEIQVAAAYADDLARTAGGLSTGTAVRHDGAWWCLVTPTRALVLCDGQRTSKLADELRAHDQFHVVDVTSQYCALRLTGPDARETIARFCALDLRDHRTPVFGFRPGSIARTPGYLLRESEQDYLLLGGAAFADYLSQVVSDAGSRLGVAHA